MFQSLDSTRRMLALCEEVMYLIFLLVVSNLVSDYGDSFVISMDWSETK